MSMVWHWKLRSSLRDLYSWCDQGSFSSFLSSIFSKTRMGSGSLNLILGDRLSWDVGPLGSWAFQSCDFFQSQVWPIHAIYWVTNHSLFQLSRLFFGILGSQTGVIFSSRPPEVSNYSSPWSGSCQLSFLSGCPLVVSSHLKAVASLSWLDPSEYPLNLYFDIVSIHGASIEQLHQPGSLLAP